LLLGLELLGDLQGSAHLRHAPVGGRQAGFSSSVVALAHARVVLLAGLRPSHVVVVLHKENRVPLNDQRHALLIQEKKINHIIRKNMLLIIFALYAQGTN
jgi:hypothetical protein